MNKGILYLVATPIGNLEDITYRAVRVLSEVAVVASEDTRRTGQLLNHLNIKKPLISYYEQNKDTRTPELVQRLLSGESIALVSDAGLPGIADPGVQLVQACVASGVIVSPIPGANAALSALICSGMDTRQFVFLGFLPRTSKRSRELLELFVNRNDTLIIYEAPHRIQDTLAVLSKTLGNRPAVAARELTKKYEQFVHSSLDELIDYFAIYEPRGEFVLVVSGSDGAASVAQSESIDMPLMQQLNELIVSGMSRNEALRAMMKHTGMSKRDLYKKIEELKGEEPL